jgi:hypothetical protein
MGTRLNTHDACLSAAFNLLRQGEWREYVVPFTSRRQYSPARLPQFGQPVSITSAHTSTAPR